MVAAWTLEPPFAVTARARRACRDDDGGFVLRNAPPGRQEPNAAVVIPAAHPPWHRAAKPAQRPTRWGGVWPEREAHGAGQTPASPHETAPRRNRDAGTVSPRQSIVTRMGQDRLRGSVKRSGIARWSRHYWPRTFESLPLGTSHHRSAVRPGKPARPIMTSTARSASSSCRRGAGAGGDDEKLIAAALGVLRLSVTTTR